VNRHRFDADSDPDPTVHFDADPDPDPTPGFTHVGKSKFFFIHSSAGLHGFFFLISVTCVKFSIFWTVYRIEFFWRKKSIV
jgi:hypothetical protein